MRAHSCWPDGRFGTGKLVSCGPSGPLFTRSSAALAVPTVRQYSLAPATADQLNGWAARPRPWSVGVTKLGVAGPTGATGAAGAGAGAGATGAGASGAAGMGVTGAVGRFMLTAPAGPEGATGAAAVHDGATGASGGAGG